MVISIIAALSKNKVIGINNDLPWRLPDDMKFFMETTSNHVVIMGRKNYESIPTKFRPLPNRINVILTMNTTFQADGCVILASLDEAISFAKDQGEKEAFIIGGGQVYQEAIVRADYMYLTEIDANIKNGEVFFPEYGNEWREVARKPHAKDTKHKYWFDFVKYERQYEIL